jgi:hypothetical protein
VDKYHVINIYLVIIRFGTLQYLSNTLYKKPTYPSGIGVLTLVFQ